MMNYAYKDVQLKITLIWQILYAMALYSKRHEVII